MTSTNTTRHAKADLRRPAGRYLRLNKNAKSSKPVTIQTGTEGPRGSPSGIDGGAKNESVVVKVAEQDAAVVLVAATGAQFCGFESAVEPFMNTTVPVGPAPLLFVVTFAVKLIPLPDTMLVTVGTTPVAVTAFVTVSVLVTGPAAL